MREILFKAKRLDNGEWVEGYYVCFNGSAYFIYYGYAETDCGGFYPDMFEIDPNTLCQYTGLTDKNGKKIWENDIMKYEWGGRKRIDVIKYQPPIFTYNCTFRWSLNQDEVLGNIFDNPELMKGEEYETD